MIVYELQCEASHRFEGWFASSEIFENQLASGEIACPFCGGTNLRRLPSAAHLSSGGVAGKQEARIGERATAEAVLKELIEHVRANYEDVGTNFPEEARRIHYGESSERNIRGVASAKELGDLIEEGVAVAPVPAIDTDKLN